MIPLIIGAGLLAALVVSGKKKKAAPAEPFGQAEDAGRVYGQAMAPDMRDLEWMRRAVDFLTSVGMTELAGNVASRIASLQATAGAEAAAQSEAAV